MAAGSASPEDQFAELVELFAGGPNVTTPDESPRRSFGSSALKVNNKIFAMLAGGTLVVKLPGSRVTELIGTDQGLPFDAGKGKPMKEWLSVPPGDREQWAALSREALEFVRGRR